MDETKDTTAQANTPEGGTALPADGQDKTATTGEQQNAFQKFMATLFGEKADGKVDSSAEDKATPPAKPAGDKTYTEAELSAALDANKQHWEAQRQEEARLAKLPPDERAKAESEARDKKLADLEGKLLHRELKDTAVAQLAKDGYPAGLADVLIYTDKTSMEESLGNITAVFKSCLEAAINERLRGKTPEGLGRAARSENSMRDEIARNIRGGLM